MTRTFSRTRRGGWLERKVYDDGRVTNRFVAARNVPASAKKNAPLAGSKGGSSKKRSTSRKSAKRTSQTLLGAVGAVKQLPMGTCQLSGSKLECNDGGLLREFRIAGKPRAKPKRRASRR